MNKKRSSEIFGVDMEILSGKKVIKKFFRRPKLGAKSPPMVHRHS